MEPDYADTIRRSIQPQTLDGADHGSPDPTAFVTAELRPDIARALHPAAERAAFRITIRFAHDHTHY
jgi:hypothetical protein